MTKEMPLVGHSMAIFASSAVMLAVSVIAVAMRCLVRSYVVRAFGWDDSLMVVALVLFITLTVSCMIGADNGIGHKNEDFKSILTLKKALLFWWLNQMFYLWATSLAKISIGVALLRLAVKKSHRIFVWVMISTVIAIGLMFWLVLLFDCKPVSYFWNQVDLTHSGTCTSINTLLAIAYFYSSVTIVCDLALGILPVFLVWNLQMNHRTKIAVGGILSLGAVASVAVIIRLPFLHHYADTDFLYSTYQIAVWSVIETGLGITAGSLMTLRPLFRWLLDGSMSYGRNGRSGRTSSRKHTLSKPHSHELNSLSNPSYWRPDIDAGKGIVNTVSSPRSNTFDDDNSSQEALYVDPSPIINPNRVTVHQTFDQVVSERKI
ncbi:hypothetical protein N7509_010768 [Penicillium cosmopolitanum]|uniref:Rhodopsin domain-containing protein n=1 Tax=Penicillium cosmopolitanum TaxID=1131564 RepID=A0A9W9VRY6_9EURO|nr:uncharacterized protein N7509_010768 [Penicillium cosmopolitanum]KAJ5388227.1 hypothetical protein N7509_010768 [Penicillium cosmopolitanum]